MNKQIKNLVSSIDVANNYISILEKKNDILFKTLKDIVDAEDLKMGRKSVKLRIEIAREVLK